MASTDGRRVIVCGGRDYFRRGVVFSELSRLHLVAPIATIVQGGADGADMWARAWAAENGVAIETFRASWGRDGRAAGPMRNTRMAAHGGDLCVAFPGGRGTADMLRKAKAAGIRCELAP